MTMRRAWWFLFAMLIAVHAQADDVTNGILIGLTPNPIAVHVVRFTLSGNSATLTLGPSTAGPVKRYCNPQGQSQVGLIELQYGGRTFTFEDAHVLYQDITIPANTQPTETLLITFTTMTGPPVRFRTSPSSR